MYNRYYPYLYNRSKEPLQPPAATIIPKPPISPPIAPKPPVPPPKPPKPPKKKFDFKSFRKETSTSLNDVECFLNDFCHTWKYIKLIKLLK